jgi:hypothetical protein
MNINKFDEIAPNDSAKIIAAKINANFKKLQTMMTQMQEEYKNIIGHTTAIPDVRGACTDHDARYYTKTEIDALLP